MDNRAIGIFDSGLGGLTTVKELRKLLPNEHLIYFGDTGRMPYGTRGRELVRKYAAQDIHFLQQFDVKMIIAACGTVSATITPEMVKSIGVPFSGVVLPAAQAACAASTGGRIGVVGTPATVRSGAYGRAIRNISADMRVFGSACPLLVPLVENGFIQPDNPVTRMVAERYLKPIIEEQVDTLILGCTHFPIIYDIFNPLLNYKVTLIDPGKQVARWAQSFLASEDQLAEGAGKCEFYVTDSIDNFSDIAGIFLGSDLTGQVTQIDIDAVEI